MHTSKLNKFWHQLSSFIAILWAGANCKFIKLVNPQILCGCTQAIKQEKVHIWGQLKLTYINFAILNSHVIVLYLRFIKNTYFYVVKQINWRELYWLFSSKKTVTKKRNLSENLSFQNLLKNRKLLPAEKFGNILTFDKESKRKLLSLMSADSLIKNNLYIYNFRETWRVKFFLWKSFWF